MDKKRKKAEYVRKHNQKMKVERGVCSVPRCNQPVRAGGRFLCSFHFYNEESVFDGYGGDHETLTYAKERVRVDEIIDGMVLPDVVYLSCKDYTQEELAHYLQHSTLPDGSVPEKINYKVARERSKDIGKERGTYPRREVQLG